jgi:hypothetical protein
VTKRIGPPLIVLLVVAGIAAAVFRPAAHATPLMPRASRPDGFATVIHAQGYLLRLSIAPNRATARGIVSVKLLRDGRAVNAARIKLTFSMLDMPMATLSGLLPQAEAGTYAHTGPVLGMSGRWGLHLDVTPPGVKRFSVDAVDRIPG